MFIVQDSNATWQELQFPGAKPTPRGWFAATGLPDGILIHGGIVEDNSRLADMHLLKLR